MLKTLPGRELPTLQAVILHRNVVTNRHKVKFTDDLGLDSLDVVEVVMAIEDEFAIEIPDAEADKISSIADAVEYITSHPMAK